MREIAVCLKLISTFGSWEHSPLLPRPYFLDFEIAVLSLLKVSQEALLLSIVPVCW